MGAPHCVNLHYKKVKSINLVSFKLNDLILQWAVTQFAVCPKFAAHAERLFRDGSLIIVAIDSVSSSLLVDVKETETTLSACYLIVLRAIIMEKCSKVENIVSIAVNTSAPFWGCLV